MIQCRLVKDEMAVLVIPAYAGIQYFRMHPPMVPRLRGGPAYRDDSLQLSTIQIMVRLWLDRFLNTPH